MGGNESDDSDEQGERARSRTELLWRIGILIALAAFVVFLISIYEDPGPVCGTGQDKGPC